MLSFAQFVVETKDAQAHGYQLHVLENRPKGHHTILATHPKAGRNHLHHNLWLDREVFRNGTPEKYHKGVVGLATINSATHEPYNLYVHDKHRRKGLASAMYDQYKTHTGNDVKPSESLSQDAKDLWKARTTK